VHAKAFQTEQTGKVNKTQEEKWKGDVKWKGAEKTRAGQR
jgi:hypothetical protein